MDQPGNAPHLRSTPQTANGKLPADPAALPPSPARRAQLLLILIVLPVVAVTLPAIVITSIFGQHPKGKEIPPKPVVSNVSGLNEALQRSASNLLPTPSTLTGEPINLKCRPDRLAARTQRVIELAGAFGGTANEWLGAEGEKHFYVELPAGSAGAFRQSLVGDAPVSVPPPSAAPAPGAAVATTKDQVEVFIRANSED